MLSLARLLGLTLLVASSGGGCPPRSAGEPRGDADAGAPPVETTSAEEEPTAQPEPPPTTTTEPPPPLGALVWRTDGREVALAHRRVVELLSAVSGAPARLGPFEADVVAIEPSERSDLYAVALANNSIELWDAARRVKLRALEAAPEGLERVRFSLDGKLVGAAGSSTIRVWNVKTAGVVGDFEGRAIDLAFVAGTKHLIASRGYGQDVFELATGRTVSSAGLDTGGTFPDAVSSDGAFAASAATDGHGLKVFTTHPYDAGRSLFGVDSCNEHVIFVDFSRDRKTLFAAQQNGVRWAFTVGSWVLRARWAPNAEDVKTQVGVAMSEDGLLGAISREDGATRVYDATTGRSLKLLEGAGRFQQLAFSPTSHELVGVEDGKRARLWSLATGRVERELDAPLELGPDSAPLGAGQGIF